MLRKMTKETGYPIFSIDYRLAPDYPHPIPLSDCWMVYLWLQYYCEEYFQLTFDKIILAGDSAGGTLCSSLSLLSILKGCKVPNGIYLLYPALNLNRYFFTPSILCSLDDPILNTAFLDFCIKAYDPTAQAHKDFLLSPYIAPDEMFVKDGAVIFPPTRMLIPGGDPLRDSSLLFMIRLAKLGVNVKGVDYQYQMHGFLMFNKPPIGFKESAMAVDTSIEYIQKLGGLTQNACMT